MGWVQHSSALPVSLGSLESLWRRGTETGSGMEAGDVLLALHTHKHLPLNRTVTAYVPPTCTKTVKKMTVMMAVRNMSLMPKCL